MKVEKNIIKEQMEKRLVGMEKRMRKVIDTSYTTERKEVVMQLDELKDIQFLRLLIESL